MNDVPANSYRPRSNIFSDTMKGGLGAVQGRPAVTHLELLEAVEERLQGKFQGPISGYVEATKLNLLARGVVIG